MRFKILEGVHQTADGKMHKKGDVISSPSRLDKIFRGKFALVQGLDVEEGGASHPVSPFGNDVTSIVDHRTSSSEIKVYHRAGWYTVVDKDSQVLTEPKLRRDKLTEWLNEYFENLATESELVEE